MKIEEIKKICANLKTNKNPPELDLSEDSIGYEGLELITDALKKNKTLLRLSLLDTYIGGYEGLKLITDALEKNKTLTALDLSGNIIGDEGAKLISDALKVNTTLTALGLWKTHIGYKGLKLITDALKVNTTLTVLDLAEALDLSDNIIGYNGIRAIVDVLKVNKTLAKLDLSGDKIEYVGIKLIADVLKVNKTLTTLDLSNNLIVNAGAKLITDALEKNKTLTILNLSNNLTVLNFSFSNNLIENEAEKLIDKALQANKDYVSEVVKFLSTKSLLKEIKNNILDTDNKEEYFKKIKYFKGYQAIDKELLSDELIKSDEVKDTKSFLKNVKTYIKAHLFQLSGVSTDPSVKVVSYYKSKTKYSERKQDLYDKNYSFNPVNPVGHSLKRKLSEDSNKSKLDNSCLSFSSNILEEKLISNLISEFLGEDHSLFAVKLPPTSSNSYNLDIESAGDDNSLLYKFDDFLI